MVKEHSIKVTISNNSGIDMDLRGDWFDSGRLADAYSWPQKISNGQKTVTQCYEKDWSMAGCSGEVTYVMSGTEITIAFSNPKVGTNKLNVGVDGRRVFDTMSNNDYNPFVIRCFVGEGIALYFNMKCSGGTTNEASIDIVREG